MVSSRERARAKIAWKSGRRLVRRFVGGWLGRFVDDTEDTGSIVPVVALPMRQV